MKVMTEQDFLRECFEYNPMTGDFIWKVRPRDHFITTRAWKIWNSRFSGKVSGGITLDGYRMLGLNGIATFAHRVAWVFMTGRLPEQEIDHVDHNRTNNAWANLRAVTRGENCKNQTISKKNTSGMTGVSWSKTHKNWRADVSTKHGRFAKHFESFDEAAQAVLAARQERSFHENHGEQHVV